MANSSRSFGARKPHPDDPTGLLRRRSLGQENPRQDALHRHCGGALDVWLQATEREPRETNGERTVLEICDRFLVAKQVRFPGGFCESVPHRSAQKGQGQMDSVD